MHGIPPLLLACLLATACATHRAPSPQPVLPQTDQPRALLLRELQRRSPREPLDTARVVLLDDTSSIPGVVYHWGVYHPRRASPHFGPYTVVVAEHNGRAHVIRLADDWFRATGRNQPTNRDEMLRACLEAIHTSAEFKRPWGKPRIYDGPDSLEGVTIGEETRGLLAQRLHAPSVERTAEPAWRAWLWAIDLTSVTRYECVIGRDWMAVIARDAIRFNDDRYPFGG